MAYVVSFCVEPPRDVELVQAIKALGEWGRLTPTSFILECENDPGVIMEQLQPMLGPKDDLWMISASGPWAAYGDPIVEELMTWVGPEASWVPRDWDEKTASRP
jgi:hypothetical protein